MRFSGDTLSSIDRPSAFYSLSDMLALCRTIKASGKSQIHSYLDVLVSMGEALSQAFVEGSYGTAHELVET